MAGQVKSRLRKEALDATRKAAELAAKGDGPGAAEALAKAAKCAEEVRRMEENPAYVSDGDRKEAEAAKLKEARTVLGPCRRKRQRSDAAVRLVGSEAAAERTSRYQGDVASEAGEMAAEAAVAGVRKEFFSAIPPSSGPEPLSQAEIEAVKGVVLASGEDGSGELSDPDIVDSFWLAAAFPDLNPPERVRCGRFLAGMCALSAEAPQGADAGGTVAERALWAAGMTWTAFESARTKDTRFNDAQAAVTGARKRAVMTLMEERLWDRAYNGQIEEALTRAGDVVEVRKFDNTLSFNLLKFGHEQYALKMVKDKAAANAMTLMVANGFMPKALPPPVAREPKTVEMREAGQ